MRYTIACLSSFGFLILLMLLCHAASLLAQSPRKSTLQTFRCGNDIVQLGDRASEIRETCGDPDHREAWTERRIFRDHGNPFSRRRRQYDSSRNPIITEKYVRVEEWTYDLGPTKFVRYLIFENGILQEIHLGDYGD